jgi:DNA-binding NtrC family response regulator
MATSESRILIVDDEERFRTTMCKLLRAHGYDAHAVGTGQEAIRKVIEEVWDVMILDMKMPEMGGVQVLSEVRELDSRVEVIVLTGYASIDTVQEVMKFGAYDYLLKPYHTEELLEKIENALDRKTARKMLVDRGSETT